MNKILKLNIVIYTTIWCFIIGITTAGYLNLVNWIIHFIWKTSGTLIPAELLRPFFICIPFGVLIGYLNKYLGNYPLTIGEVLGEIHSNGRIQYQNWWKNMLLGLVALGGGGDIGPEASTTALTTGMVNWLGDRIKVAARRTDLNLKEQCKTLWIRPLDQTVAQKGTFKELFKSKRRYSIFILYGILIAVLGLALFFKAFPQEGVFGIHHSQIIWQWQGIFTLVLAVLGGWIFGYFFIKCGQISKKLTAFQNKFSILKGILGGLILAFGSLITRDILFSGEFQIVKFTHQALMIAPLFLVIIAFLKAVVSNMGFFLGWRGGTIFPAIFASVAWGAVLVHILPWMPQLMVTGVVTASLSVILDRPIIIIAIIAVMFPIQFLLIVIGICYFTIYLKKKILAKKIM